MNKVQNSPLTETLLLSVSMRVLELEALGYIPFDYKKAHRLAPTLFQEWGDAIQYRDKGRTEEIEKITRRFFSGRLEGKGAKFQYAYADRPRRAPSAPQEDSEKRVFDNFTHADAFNWMAKAITVLAFEPGGVNISGCQVVGVLKKRSRGS